MKNNKHIVVSKNAVKIQKNSEKKIEKQSFLQKLFSPFSSSFVEDEDTRWLRNHTRIRKKDFYYIPPAHLRRICEKIDPIIVITMLEKKNNAEAKIILEELYKSVLEGFKAVCREGNNKNNRPISKEHLVAMVRNFTPREMSPLVIGHPENNFPAFGYVSRLKVIDNYLFATYQDVPVQLEELINDGFYNYVSISMSIPIYKKDIGYTSLRHIGLCGGFPPAVTKLGYLRFQEGDIKQKRCGLNDAQKEVIGTCFMSVPQFKKSYFMEKGLKLLTTAFYPIGIPKMNIEKVNQIIQSTQYQEIPLLYHIENAENPPALGYVNKFVLENNRMYVSFKNIPEIVEGFVLESLEKNTLKLFYTQKMRDNKIYIDVSWISL
ncbi:MAG: hypothetical protein ACRCV3_06155 [Desulfovibrionaceae bacterium]